MTLKIRLTRATKLSFLIQLRTDQTALFHRRSYSLSLTTAWLVVASVLFLTASPGRPAYAKPPGFTKSNYILPPEIQKQGFTFAQVKIPLDRTEVTARIVDQMNYLLMDRRAGLMEWFDRMAIFGPMMASVLREEKVPADLIYVAVLVSDLSPSARTKTGGLGWWGLGPGKEKKNSTSAPWLSTNDWDDRRDPVISTRMAVTILQGLLKKPADNDWLLAIAAFADGADKVDAIVQKAPGFSYWDLVMPPYSDVLIPRAVALKIIDTHRQFYGVDIPVPPPLSYDSLDKLKFVKDLPLQVVAKWCEINPRSMWELNPGVDPGNGVLLKPDAKSSAGYSLRVPKGRGGEVRKLLVREGYVSE